MRDLCGILRVVCFATLLSACSGQPIEARGAPSRRNDLTQLSFLRDRAGREAAGR